LAAYKRTILIVNPRFQIKLALIVCSMAFITSLIYPWSIFELYEKIIALQPVKAKDAEENRMQLMIFLLVIELALIGIIFISTIFISHRIAGPMYKLKNYLINIRNGAPIEPIYFRAGDNFKDIAEEVSQTFNYITEQRKEDLKYLGEVISYINNLALVVPEDKKPVIREITTKLVEIQNRHQ
jgi:hypothetical protein